MKTRHFTDPALFAPMVHTIAGGLTVTRTIERINASEHFDPLIDRIERHRGAVLSSGMDAPGRYQKGRLGFADPILVVEAQGRSVRIQALNPRGRVVLPALAPVADHDDVGAFKIAGDEITLTIPAKPGAFAEEDRSRQPTVFSVLRFITQMFALPGDPFLGLYGAFGYDLAFQFEAIPQRLVRDEAQRDLVLYLPDTILAESCDAGVALRIRYDFQAMTTHSVDLAGGGKDSVYTIGANTPPIDDHAPGAYARTVEKALSAFNRGDLFETVPGQSFFRPCDLGPATVYRRLIAANPAPYEALINLGQGEFLVSASPEMFVRVTDGVIETCPISGTIARGGDPIADAEQIRTLLNASKDEAELTMCTDVDRNDKARVCVAGSVRVKARRQIETYSRLFHTVDHVEGTLRPGFDALDGFLTHAWAVTVTGAPKARAMRFIEEHELSPRRWYGGAFGRIGFDGALDTGLTLRTIRMQGGVAEVRVGATLLSDSLGEAEDAECRLKAAALFDAITLAPSRPARPPAEAVGLGKRVLLIDHDDSFVLTLADYFRQTGAEVRTLRHHHAADALMGDRPDLVVLSPGPGTPTDFAIARTLDIAIARNLPVFGVCLGLQGMVEYFGGALGVLPRPMHGKPSPIIVRGGRLLRGLPDGFRAGRYHSLYARRDALPAELIVTADTPDGVVMAVEHRSLPLAAVQFHPESIMTLGDGLGRRLIDNAVSRLRPLTLTPAVA